MHNRKQMKGRSLYNNTRANVLGERFETALVYALRLHRHQRRKVTGVPYICHLLAVAAMVIEAGADEDCAIAALLHDAVEDQGGSSTLLAIRQQFGGRVAEYVSACSAPSRRGNQDWRSHKIDYLAQIEAAPVAVKQIVLADKLHNGRSLLSNLSQFGPRLIAVQRKLFGCTGITTHYCQKRNYPYFR